MYLNHQEAIFDTLIDTSKIYVAMTHSFSLRKDSFSDNKCPIYLIISANKKRERIHTDIYIAPQHWDSVKKVIKPLSKELIDYQLILDAISAKINKIKIEYRLTERVLTPKILREQLKNNMSRINFIPFYFEALEKQRNLMEEGSYKRYLSVGNKMKAYKSEILFSEINANWFVEFRGHLARKKNKETTINSNIKAIKKFLLVAVRNGIKIPINIEDIKTGSTKGNKTYLSKDELKQCFKFYDSEFIKDNQKIILGYFLFSCVTGLRISDLQNLERKNITKTIQFVSQKTSKDQFIELNQKARYLIETCPELFVVKYRDQYMNRDIKDIMKCIKINKSVSFHVGRHTFATLFLQAKGKAEYLQKLLGHTTIRQTMEYVHILQEEANKEIHLLDDFLK